MTAVLEDWAQRYGEPPYRPWMAGRSTMMVLSAPILAWYDQTHGEGRRSGWSNTPYGTEVSHRLPITQLLAGSNVSERWLSRARANTWCDVAKVDALLIHLDGPPLSELYPHEHSAIPLYETEQWTWDLDQQILDELDDEELLAEIR